MLKHLLQNTQDIASICIVLMKNADVILNFAVILHDIYLVISQW